MNSSQNRINNQHAPIEDLFRDKLINHLVVMSALLSVFALGITQLRAHELGWNARDLIYFFIVASVILIAFFRQKLTTRHKAISIISLYISVGVVGCYTLGMLAGAVFFFPISAVILALFYSARAVAVFSIFSIGYLCLIAIGFSSNYLKLNPNADFFLSNYAHWGVYIICVALFFMISCVTILNYRRVMRELIDNVNCQREKIEKTNKDLQRAIDEIKTLRGILPICSFCKKIRDDKGYWEQVEVYIHKHSEADISHSICPECLKKHYPEKF